MRDLLERLTSIGNPEFRAVGATAFANFVRDFAGNLAMKTTASGEPEQEIVANSPKVRGAVKDALTALGKLGRAILDTERSIDITPAVRGRLAAEAREAGHLNKYDPGSLLGAVVALLEREGLDDAAAAVRDVSRQVSRAWQEWDK
jgi:hypothetical protein